MCDKFNLKASNQSVTVRQEYVLANGRNKTRLVQLPTQKMAAKGIEIRVATEAPKRTFFPPNHPPSPYIQWLRHNIRRTKEVTGCNVSYAVFYFLRGYNRERLTTAKTIYPSENAVTTKSAALELREFTSEVENSPLKLKYVLDNSGTCEFSECLPFLE
ncbi:hypothetical protein AVEN_115079-1 [Araneus ventricosus]|uniref:Uncharacterized protein n=1 Tax=Araneus ventricosus TaxID=182803 RepID=A0A4Y1ZYZ7_ARAVE|nr:hypothetical protein AVEN_115079-1 [Araneus ventricosus]